MTDLPDVTAAAVARYLALQEAGQTPELEAFCAEFPPAQRALIAERCAQAAVAGAVLGALRRGRPPPADLVGHRLGEFELVAELGRGGMGAVYLARQPALQRDVAVKVLAARDATARAVERFRTEALATARIADPRIVKVHAVGEQDGLLWIAMEAVRGHSVHADLALLRAGQPSLLPPPRDRAAIRAHARFFAQAAHGLHAAHQAGVLHRDVQPKNLLIDEQGEPRWIDFGLARISEQPGQTQTGEIMGTPFYMSPEQVRARPAEIDHRSDQFSLAAVLYEALTLDRPFDGDTSQQVFEAITRREPRPITQRNPQVPPDLARVVHKALTKAAIARFADLAVLADELLRFAAGEEVHLRAPTPLQLAARALRRHRVAVGLGAALLAASGVGAAIAAGRAPKSVLAMRAPGLHGAEVWIAAVEPTRWEIGRYARLGVAPLQARVGLGHYRVVVRRDGAFVELTQRADVAEQEYEVGATARLLAAASTAGMVLVPACEFTFGHGDQPHLPSTAQRRVRLAAFWIDEAEVSNRDYRAFLLATGHKKPAMWPADWKENWNAAWDDLPAAGVLHASARAYAAWAGKRLPTEQEWERAARGTDGWLLPWRADFDADDVRRRCNVERPFSNEAAWPPRFANYLAVAQPVRSGAGRSAAGLFHCVGNVGEWVDNAHSVRDGDVERVSFEVRLRGADSHDDPPKWRLPMAFWVAPETNLQTYGFRCARSAADPTTNNPK